MLMLFKLNICIQSKHNVLVWCSRDSYIYIIYKISYNALSLSLKHTKYLPCKHNCAISYIVSLYVMIFAIHTVCIYLFWSSGRHIRWGKCDNQDDERCSDFSKLGSVSREKDVVPSRTSFYLSMYIQ